MIPLRNLKRFAGKTLRQPGYAWRVFTRRLKANLCYLASKGTSSPPESITLFLTHRCNLRCIMCGQWGEGGVTRQQSAQYVRQELSSQELRSIIEDVSSFKPNITLFGGEPLLHPGCIEAIKHIKQKAMHCLMITNGSMIEDSAEEIAGSGLDELNVSLDGNASLHDQIRGMPGLFERIMRGLKKVKAAKESLKTKKPLVNLQCTINRLNYKFLEQMTQVAGDAGADSLTYHNLIFIEKELIERQKKFNEELGCDSLDWEGFISKPGIDPVILHEKIQQILSAKYAFNVDFYPNFSYKELLAYYQDPGYKPAGYSGRCLSPWIAAYIFPDGEVRPCLNFSYSFGNLKEEKFLKVWNGDDAIKFRLALRANKSFPVCARCTELYRY
ncbi:MAG: radical SAM protein [Candidatus Omnitrophica bacterium]|nr:radical SAM protein [Candidatus Omnitrophota bacterium]